MANQAHIDTDIKNQQLSTKTIKVKMGQLIREENTIPLRGLPSDTKKNLK